MQMDHVNVMVTESACDLSGSLIFSIEEGFFPAFLMKSNSLPLENYQNIIYQSPAAMGVNTVFCKHPSY